MSVSETTATPAAAPSTAWYAKSAEETASAVDVAVDTGLSTTEAAARQAKNGPNALAAEATARAGRGSSPGTSPSSTAGPAMPCSMPPTPGGRRGS
jgi:hypothetical protein